MENTAVKTPSVPRCREAADCGNHLVYLERAVFLQRQQTRSAGAWKGLVKGTDFWDLVCADLVGPLHGEESAALNQAASSPQAPPLTGSPAGPGGQPSARLN